MDIDNEHDPWVTVAEAAQITGKSEKTIRRWVSSDKVAHKREKGRIYVDLSSLDAPKGHIVQDKVDADQTGQTSYGSVLEELASLRAENRRQADEIEYLRQLNLMAMSKIPSIEAGPAQPTKGLLTRIKEFFVGQK